MRLSAHANARTYTLTYPGLPPYRGDIGVIGGEPDEEPKPCEREYWLRYRWRWLLVAPAVRVLGVAVEGGSVPR